MDFDHIWSAVVGLGNRRNLSAATAYNSITPTRGGPFSALVTTTI